MMIVPHVHHQVQEQGHEVSNAAEMMMITSMVMKMNMIIDICQVKEHGCGHEVSNAVEFPCPRLVILGLPSLSLSSSSSSSRSLVIVIAIVVVIVTVIVNGRDGPHPYPFPGDTRVGSPGG